MCHCRHDHYVDLTTNLCDLSFKEKTSDQTSSKTSRTIYLISLLSIRALEVLQHVDAVEKPIPEQYPELFNGLGTFSGEYTIKLKLHMHYTLRGKSSSHSKTK